MRTRTATTSSLIPGGVDQATQLPAVNTFFYSAVCRMRGNKIARQAAVSKTRTAPSVREFKQELSAQELPIIQVLDSIRHPSASAWRSLQRPALVTLFMHVLSAPDQRQKELALTTPKNPGNRVVSSCAYLSMGAQLLQFLRLPAGTVVPRSVLTLTMYVPTKALVRAMCDPCKSARLRLDDSEASKERKAPSWAHTYVCMLFQHAPSFLFISRTAVCLLSQESCGRDGFLYRRGRAQRRHEPSLQQALPHPQVAAALRLGAMAGHGHSRRRYGEADRELHRRDRGPGERARSGPKPIGRGVALRDSRCCTSG